tara:strand:+ start:840 stop:2120 length:1281 start_codon:yes stop_codon:yes gene_type:complete
MQKGLQSRLSVYLILKSLVNNKSTYDKLFKKEIEKNKYSTRDINFIQSVVLSSLRHNLQVKKIIDKFSNKKINKDTYVLLLGAITQLVFLNFKDYAVVNSTVELSKENKINAYSGFINGILKNIIKEKENLKKTKIKLNDLPKWFVDKITNKNFDKKNNIINSITEKPDLHLVFKNHFFLKNFLKVRKNEDIKTSEISLKITDHSNIEKLPRYDKGEWWVQDFSSMLPIYLCKEIKNKKIIDLCAAPGGKTFQSLAKNNKLTIIEKNKERGKTLNSNLKRLNFSNSIKIMDALDVDEEQKYDVILIDAPCSSVGTIRKNPEIFFRKNREDINKYIQIQKKLLKKSVQLSNKNGLIIYMVCSFLEEETTRQIDDFLKLNNNFYIEKFKTSAYKKLIDKNGYINCFPTTINNQVRIDGFFAAKIKRDD